MYIFRNVPFEVIWRFGWKNIMYFLLYGIFMCFLHHFLRREGYTFHIPFALMGTIGVAVAIYAGFKNSQSYDRNWEARKNWGALAVASRVFANQLNMYVHPAVAEEIKILVDRQIAYLNALKLQLRRKSSHSRTFGSSIKKYYFGEPTEADWQEEVFSKLANEDIDSLRNSSNKALQILFLQNRHLKQLHQHKQLDEYRLVEMVNTLNTCIENHGKNERLKTTPFPRQYAFFSKSFVIIFILILPLGILDLYQNYTWLGYMAITFLFTLIAWLYITMELVSDNSEDPFENFITDIPMSSIIRNVEIDLYELFQFSGKPVKVEAKDGVMM